MHDDALTMRTTDVADRFPDRVPAPFSTYTLAYSILDAGAWFERDDPFGQVAAGAVEPSELLAYVGEKVPTLREAFELTLELDWFLNLELKAQPKPKHTFDVVGAVLALADEVGIRGPDHLLFSSAQHAWLKALKQRRPEFEVQAVLGLFPEDPIDFSDPFFDTFNPRITRVSMEQIEEQLARGIRLNPFTVNDPETMARLTEIGITPACSRTSPSVEHEHDVPDEHRTAPVLHRQLLSGGQPRELRPLRRRSPPRPVPRLLRREARTRPQRYVYVADLTSRRRPGRRSTTSTGSSGRGRRPPSTTSTTRGSPARIASRGR